MPIWSELPPTLRERPGISRIQRYSQKRYRPIFLPDERAVYRIAIDHRRHIYTQALIILFRQLLPYSIIYRGETKGRSARPRSRGRGLPAPPREPRKLRRIMVERDRICEIAARRGAHNVRIFGSVESREKAASSADYIRSPFTAATLIGLYPDKNKHFCWIITQQNVCPRSSISWSRSTPGGAISPSKPASGGRTTLRRYRSTSRPTRSSS